MGTAAAAAADAEAQLKQFVDKFEPEHRRLIRALRKALRKEFPGAYELVYDNYNFFVIGYSPTDRPSDAIVSLTANAKGLGLCFLRGASLRDPKGILLGAGRQTRFIRLDSAATLARSEVRSLMSAARAHSKTPMRGDGRLIIRSVSAKQRPRRSTER